MSGLILFFTSRKDNPYITKEGWHFGTGEIKGL